MSFSPNKARINDLYFEMFFARFAIKISQKQSKLTKNRFTDSLTDNKYSFSCYTVLVFNIDIFYATSVDKNKIRTDSITKASSQAYKVKTFKNFILQLYNISQDMYFKMETVAIVLSQGEGRTFNAAQQLVKLMTMPKYITSRLGSPSLSLSIESNILNYHILSDYLFFHYHQTQSSITPDDNIMKYMIINIQNNQYPFNTFNDSYQHKSTIVQRTYHLDCSPRSQYLIEKVHKIIQIPLVNLIQIRFYEQSSAQINLYYQKIEHRLSQVLDDMDPIDIKMIHQQFIELVTTLGKVGIITTFNSKCCGGSHEAEGIFLKYYLEPEQIIITQDIEIIEEAVFNFCQDAMTYLLNYSQDKLPITNSCISDSKIKFYDKKSDYSSNYASSSSIQDKNDAHRLSIISKGQIGKKKSNKETYLRKLSVLSRELSEISARHRGNRNLFPQFDSKLSLETVQTSRNSIEFHLDSEPVSPTLPMTGSMPTPLLVARSKRAQELLLQVKQRLAPYNQIYNILKEIKIRR